MVAAALLEGGETVECLSTGRLGGAPGAAVLTNRRLLLVNERLWAPSVTTLSVDPSLAVHGWQDNRTATLTFVAGGHSHVVEQITDKELAVEMAGRIRSRTGTA